MNICNNHFLTFNIDIGENTMMERLNSTVLYIVGGLLVLTGVVVPFLMVMQIIRMKLWLQMIMIMFQIIGVMCGLIATAVYRTKNEREIIKKRKSRD